MPQSPSKAPNRSGPVVPRPPSWHQRLAARLVFLLGRLLVATLRIEWGNDPKNCLPPPNQGVIFCLWHNRLAICGEVFRLVMPRAQRSGKLAAMVSASRDGGLLARILELYKIRPVRGSSSRRGRQALLELTTLAERGYDLAITPDGPRGPCYTVADGVTALAQVTGLPIIPASNHFTWKLQLKSWDKFQIPLPFSRCSLRFGDPIRVPRDASDEEREKIRQQLESALNNITTD